jgi:Helicase associated domain
LAYRAAHEGSCEGPYRTDRVRVCFCSPVSCANSTLLPASMYDLFINSADNCYHSQKHGALARWVATQRTQCSKGLLHPDRIRRLNKIGFVWKARRGSRAPSRDGGHESADEPDHSESDAFSENSSIMSL